MSSLLQTARMLSGDSAQARAILQDMLAGRRHSDGVSGIAVVYIRLRDYDKAFPRLERSIRKTRGATTSSLECSPSCTATPSFARLALLGGG